MSHVVKQLEETEVPHIRTLDVLKNYKQWVCYANWSGFIVPISPVTGFMAFEDRRWTWASYEEARYWASKYISLIAGIGFMLTPEPGITVLTLENCILNGNINQMLNEFLVELEGYIELTPDKRGLNVWVQDERLNLVEEKYIQMLLQSPRSGSENSALPPSQSPSIKDTRIPKRSVDFAPGIRKREPAEEQEAPTEEKCDEEEGEDKPAAHFIIVTEDEAEVVSCR